MKSVHIALLATTLSACSFALTTAPDVPPYANYEQRAAAAAACSPSRLPALADAGLAVVAMFALYPLLPPYPESTDVRLETVILFVPLLSVAATSLVVSSILGVKWSSDCRAVRAEAATSRDRAR